MQIGLTMCLPSLSLNFLMATISFVSLRKQINRNLVQIPMLTKPIPNPVTKPIIAILPLQSLLFKSLYLYPISDQNAKICPLLTIHTQKVSIPLLISFAIKPSPGDTNMKLKLET